jgi:hypothetical protein
LYRDETFFFCSLAKKKVVVIECFKILSGTPESLKGHHVASRDAFYDMYSSRIETDASASCLSMWNEVLELAH